MTSTKKIFFIFLTVFILFFIANKIENNGNKDARGDTAFFRRDSVVINDISIKVDIADTAEKRTMGLSGRPSLAENEGVFFIFDSSYRYSFWMKEMNFPIDIIWIDENFVIADITKHAAPESFPKTFFPVLPVRYVLEVNAGWSDKNGIKVGDKVLLNRPVAY